MAGFVTRCCGHEQVTALSSSAGLASVPAVCAYAIIECDHTANKYVRYRDDGTAPTATTGISLAPGEKVKYDGDLSVIRFIEELASAKLNVSYYR